MVHQRGKTRCCEGDDVANMGKGLILFFICQMVIGIAMNQNHDFEGRFILLLLCLLLGVIINNQSNK